MKSMADMEKYKYYSIPNHPSVPLPYIHPSYGAPYSPQYPQPYPTAYAPQYDPYCSLPPIYPGY